MKKMFAVLLALCLICSMTAVACADVFRVGVKQDVYGKASSAVNMLMDVIEHPGHEAHYVMLDVELIERESVACL